MVKAFENLGWTVMYMTVLALLFVAPSYIASCIIDSLGECDEVAIVAFSHFVIWGAFIACLCKIIKNTKINY